MLSLSKDIIYAVIDYIFHVLLCYKEGRNEFGVRFPRQWHSILVERFKCRKLGVEKIKYAFIMNMLIIFSLSFILIFSNSYNLLLKFYKYLISKNFLAALRLKVKNTLSNIFELCENVQTITLSYINQVLVRIVL